MVFAGWDQAAAEGSVTCWLAYYENIFLSFLVVLNIIVLTIHLFLDETWAALCREAVISNLSQNLKNNG